MLRECFTRSGFSRSQDELAALKAHSAIVTPESPIVDYIAPMSEAQTSTYHVREPLCSATILHSGY